MTASLVVGSPAPTFTLPGHDGAPITLESFKGKALVLYFYPKDDTPGCTAEAIAFNGKAKAFAEAGAAILGVSPDSVKSHEKFRTKHDLAIPLASDEEKAMLGAYGVWVEKAMYGKKYMGVERTTVLIDKAGKIAKVWPKVKVPGHVDEVLAAVKALP
ncbi:putative peroxiredoxin bcp [Beijerinckiaceae bacterium RH AL1]|jgi:thioredoxin-dependent peroxiredoxin|nr:peroxiredoxin [Beijerinckiaceae bacterium]VVB46305.1 putative peroxiredoxin bcp [Beijerinckiaceae bacterium RH CH11]VVB46390.1 putative peroxiredoxin bcp [Beijerinckiaceae bacterium RH AL8]VVC55307.1 putative peroxiredoxin bcp [Beijerinckiaceae bacterium RH AL1]